MFPPPSALQKKGKEVGERAGGISRSLFSAAETAELFRLHTVFFENWYRYQDEVVICIRRMNLIQMLCVGHTFRFSQPIPCLGSDSSMFCAFGGVCYVFSVYVVMIVVAWARIDASRGG